MPPAPRKKATREAREGVIAQFIAPGGKSGVLVEVNCETDFVARNDAFRVFADDIAKKIAADANVNLESEREAAVGKMGENIKITRNARLEVSGNGLVAAYIHTGAKVGVLVEVGAGKAETVATDEFKQWSRTSRCKSPRDSPMSFPASRSHLRSWPRNAKSPRNRIA